ncbi:MAG: cbb3-type cytochrome c oxidase subunit 3 [Fibrobacteria bacterium]
MIRLVMERAGLTLWPVFSFVLFLVSSGAMLAWLYRPGSRAFYDDLARQALDQDDAGKREG